VEGRAALAVGGGVGLVRLPQEALVVQPGVGRRRFGGRQHGSRFLVKPWCGARWQGTPRPGRPGPALRPAARRLPRASCRPPHLSSARPYSMLPTMPVSWPSSSSRPRTWVGRDGQGRAGHGSVRQPGQRLRCWSTATPPARQGTKCWEPGRPSPAACVRTACRRCARAPPHQPRHRRLAARARHRDDTHVERGAAKEGGRELGRKVVDVLDKQHGDALDHEHAGRAQRQPLRVARAAAAAAAARRRRLVVVLVLLILVTLARGLRRRLAALLRRHRRQHRVHDVALVDVGQHARRARRERVGDLARGGGQGAASGARSSQTGPRRGGGRGCGVRCGACSPQRLAPRPTPAGGGRRAPAPGQTRGGTQTCRRARAWRGHR
jgi:hypothetical protein